MLGDATCNAFGLSPVKHMHLPSWPSHSAAVCPAQLVEIKTTSRHTQGSTVEANGQGRVDGGQGHHAHFMAPVCAGLTGLDWRLHPEEHTAFSKPGLPLQFSQTLVKLCVCHLESTSYCGADVVQSCVEPDPWCHQCMLQKKHFDPSADTQHRQSPCRKLILPMGARTAELMGLT